MDTPSVTPKPRTMRELLSQLNSGPGSTCGGSGDVVLMPGDNLDAEADTGPSTKRAKHKGGQGREQRPQHGGNSAPKGPSSVSRPPTSDEKWEGYDVVRMLNDPDALPAGEPGGGRVRTQIGPFFSYNPIPEYQRKRLTVLSEYYTTPVLKDIRKIIAQCDDVALRDLEWLCINYAKENCLLIRGVDIHSTYNSLRHNYRKRQFDPFCKRVRVCFEIDGTTWYTSVAQLMFLKFAREYGVVEYAREHREDIAAHRAKRSEEKLQRRKNPTGTSKSHTRQALTSGSKNKVFACAGSFDTLAYLDDHVLIRMGLGHMLEGAGKQDTR